LQPWTSLSSVLPWPFIPSLFLFPASASPSLPLRSVGSPLPGRPGAVVSVSLADSNEQSPAPAASCSAEMCRSRGPVLLASNGIKKNQHHHEPSSVKDVFQRHRHVSLIQLVLPRCVLTFWLFVRGVLLGHLS